MDRFHKNPRTESRDIEENESRTWYSLELAMHALEIGFDWRIGLCGWVRGSQNYPIGFTTQIIWKNK